MLIWCRRSFGLVYAIYICIFGLVFRHMTYISLFLDCFKNISVFLDWYVQGCRDMHVIRSFRKCFYSFLKHFVDFSRFEMHMCMFLWTFTRPASSDPGCLPYLYCCIEKQALQISIIIVTLAEAVESVLLWFAVWLRRLRFRHIL